MLKFLKFGLGSIFLVFIILVVFWVFFVDVLVENIIEAKGTEIVGAKVELQKADLSLFPSGLTLTSLQATDPDKPMTNAVDIARVAMELDVLPLLWSKVIVDEMSVEGVRFGTKRSSSGAIPGAQPPRSAADSSSFELPSLDVPDVKQILEQEDLETVKLIETLKVDIERERNTWKARLKEMPGKEQFKKYKKRVKQVKKSAKGGIGGILSGVEEVQSIKREIEVNVSQLEGAKKEFKDKIALLKTRLEQIQSAPQRDVQKLKKKYNLSAEGLSSISQLLLGKHVSPWVHQGLAWYERFKPYLEQGQATQNAKNPNASEAQDIDFLIRLVKVSMALDVGEFAGTIHNITPAQAEFGKPLTFTFNGENMKGVNAVTLDGTLDHRQASRSSDQLKFQVKGYKLQPMTLSSDKAWPVLLNNGDADVTVSAELQGQQLKANGSGLFTGLDISAGIAKDSNPLTQSLSQAMSGVSRLTVDADVTGTAEQHDVVVRSDLDEILQNAAGKMVADVASKFSQKLQNGIMEKTAKPLQSLKKNFQALGPVGGVLSDRVTQNQQLLGELLAQKIPKKILPGGLKLPF